MDTFLGAETSFLAGEKWEWNGQSTSETSGPMMKEKLTPMSLKEDHESESE